MKANQLNEGHPKAAVRRCSSKYVFLKLSQYSWENICLKSLFNKVSRLLGLKHFQKETPTQVLSREYCETFKNSFFTEHL